MSQALDGIENVVLLDFPDHPNVGDSAIWVGERKCLADLQVRVVHVASTKSYTPSRIMRILQDSPSSGIVLHGGGNFGGRYRHHHDLRVDVLRRFGHVPIVQAAQSIELMSASLTMELKDAVQRHERFTMICRDRDSFEVFEANIGRASPLLSPDAVHCIGHLHPRAATTRFVTLARTDEEGPRTSVESSDWLDMGRGGQQTRRRLRAAVGRTWANRVVKWDAVAQGHVARGARILGQGRIVITNRLHAVLMALLADRVVYAVDIPSAKLSHYVDTWLASYVRTGQLTIVGNFEDALQLAHRASEVIGDT